jgi:hypothetical protein
MKTTMCAALILFVLCLFRFPASADDGGYVKIIKPFTNVYEYLDPKANIIKQAKKGDYYKLIYAGPLWYQIEVNDGVGWVERQDGAIISNPPVFVLNAIPIHTFIVFLLLFIGTLLGVTVFINKQRTAEL